MPFFLYNMFRPFRPSSDKSFSHLHSAFSISLPPFTLANVYILGSLCIRVKLFWPLRRLFLKRYVINQAQSLTGLQNYTAYISRAQSAERITNGIIKTTTNTSDIIQFQTVRRWYSNWREANTLKAYWMNTVSIKTSMFIVMTKFKRKLNTYKLFKICFNIAL
jgi:hypothetical protein